MVGVPVCDQNKSLLTYLSAAAFKIITFALITHLYSKSHHPYFEFSKPST